MLPISSQPARHSVEPPGSVSGSPAPAESETEFAALFADVAHRRDLGEAKDGLSRSGARGNSRRPESPSSRTRVRAEEEEKTSTPKPNENVNAQIEAPLARAVEPVEVDAGDVPRDPDVAVPDEEHDNALNDGTVGEDVPALPLGAGDGDDFAGAQSMLEEVVPVSDADVSESIPVDGEGLPRLNVAHEVAQAAMTKSAIPQATSKRSPEKALGDANGRAADFAESESGRSVGIEETNRATGKNFLESEEEYVTLQREPLGINVARLAVAMTQPASPHELGGLLSKQLAVPDVAGVSSFEAQNPPTDQGAVLTGLHQTVNAVIEASERMKSSGQRAVDLKFSFGSDDLSVRVELHEGKLRATFRTDSAELRGALAQEWQIFQATGVDRSKRFAETVFVSNSSASSSAGDSHEKRGGRDQDMHPAVGHFEISTSRSVSAPASARAGASAASPQTAAPLTALRLHTFA